MDVSDDESFVIAAEDVLRIKPMVYDALLFSFLALAILAASARTTLRIYKFRRIEADDVLLLISTMFLIGGVLVAHATRDLAYLQMALSLGVVEQPPADFGLRMATFQLLDDLGGILTWLSIFTVKLSFLLFFKRLVTRVRYLAHWWWVALVIVLAGACVNVGLGFLICPHFGPDAVQICTIAGMTQREGIFLVVTTVIDIVTDLLIISVPIALLWRVKIDLRRKIALGTVCSLSAVMVILALVRVTMAIVRSPVDPNLPPATDSLWLFLFQNIEGAVAIIMVSVTAFRSMLGQKGQSRPTKSWGNDAKGSAPNMTGHASISAPMWQTLPEEQGSTYNNDAQRATNNSVWGAPRISNEANGKTLPATPRRDLTGPPAPPRKSGSIDSYGNEPRQAPPPHSFV